MNMSSEKVILFSACLFIVQVAAATEQTKMTSGEEVLSKIKSDIKFCSEQREWKNTCDTTVFRVSGKDMGFTEFYKLHHSFYDNNPKDEMLSIITIRHFQASENYNPEEYMQKFFEALQGYINENEHYAMMNSLGLIVDHIVPKQMDDLELISTRTGKHDNINGFFEGLVLSNFHEICVDVIKEMVGYETSKCLEWYLDEDLVRVKKFSPTVADFESELKEISTKLRYYESNISDLLDYLDTGDNQSVFYSLYLEVCNFERNIGCESYTNDKPALSSLYYDFVKTKYEKLFEQGTKELLLKYILTIESEDNREAFIKFFHEVMIKLLESTRYEQFVSVEDGPHYYLIENFCEGKIFFDLLDGYLKQIHSVEIENEHREAFKTKIDAILREIRSKKMTKIYINRELNEESILHLCWIVNDLGLFDKFYPHHSVYIDIGRTSTKSDVKRCSDICNAIPYESQNGIQRVEMYSIQKTGHTSVDEIRSKNVSYKRRVSETSNQSAIKPFEIQKTNKTIITIDQCNDSMIDQLGEDIRSLLYLCLDNNKSRIIDINVISIIDETFTIFIYVLRHQTSETEKEIQSLIYDAPFDYISRVTARCRPTERFVRCMDDTPVIFLNTLRDHLQYLQQASGRNFRIPNLIVLGDCDIIHAESIILIEKCSGMRKEMQAYTNKIYNSKYSLLLDVSISSDEIFEIDSRNSYVCDQIRTIIKPLGIFEAEFYQMLREVMKKRRITDFKSLKHGKSHDLYLYITSCDDSGINIHLCDVKEIEYYTKLLLSSPNVLENILEKVINFTTLDPAIRGLNKHTSFVKLVVRNLYNHMHYIIGNKRWYEIRLEKEECLSVLYKTIEDTLECVEVKIKNSLSKNTEESSRRNINTEAIQKSIKPADIILIAEILAKELDKLANGSIMEISSIKIKTTKDKLSSQYVNVRFLGCCG